MCKVNFKKVVCLFCAVSVILSSMAVQMFGFSAIASDEPVLPTNMLTLIDENGISSEFGATYAALKNNVTKKLSSAVNISTAEYIEFDIYIEDYSKLVGSLGTLGKDSSLDFYLSSNPVNNKANNAVAAKFSEQIKADDWNHIKLSMSDFLPASATGTFSSTSLRYWYLGYSNSSPAANSAADVSVKVKNVCSTYFVPEAFKNAISLDNRGSSETLAPSKDTTFTQIGGRHSVTGLTSADLSGADYIMFDVKTENFTALKLALKVADSDFKFLLTSDTVTNKQASSTDISFSLIENDWYRAYIPKNSFSGSHIDWTNITGWCLTFSDSSTKVGDFYSNKFNIKNIGAVKTPDSSEIYNDKITEFVFSGNKVLSADSLFNTEIIATASSSELAGNTDYIQFSFYVSNIESFTDSVSNLTVNLTMSDSKTYSINFKDKIVAEGWNNVLLPKSAFMLQNASIPDNAVLNTLTLIAAASGESSDRFVLKLSDIFAVKIPKVSLPDNASTVIDEAGISTTWGEHFNYTSDNLTKKYNTPMNLSNDTWIEFDIYIEDYDSLYEAYTSHGDAPFFAMYSGNDGNSQRYSVNMASQIKHSGWNHIQLSRAVFQYVGTGDLNWSSVRGWLIYFNGKAANPAGNQRVQIANLCGTVLKLGEDPKLPDNTVATLDQNGKTVTWGTEFENTSATLSNKFSTGVDFEKATWIEFDIFIENDESLKAAYKNDSPYFGMFSGDNVNDGRLAISIDSQIKNSGWNHIKVSRASIAFVGAGYTNWKAVKGWVIYFNGSGVNPAGDQYVRVTNVCGTAIKDPELPEKAISVLDTKGITGTFGEFYHFTIDRIYMEQLPNVNFEEASQVEVDIYIDDIDRLKNSLTKSSTGNMLTFFLSSANSKDYDGNYRMWCRAYADISDQLVRSGWNHIVLDKNMFTWAGAGGQFDWSYITAFGLEFWGSMWQSPERNIYSDDLMTRVVNVCGTGVLASLPDDPDRPAKPDTSAVYISNCDSLADIYGTWNPSMVKSAKKYKTEGKASISNKITYETLIGNAMLKYLFDDIANMSDLNSIKFDLFVDLPDYLHNGKNKLSFVISSTGNARSNYYTFNIDTSTLKQGWNSISLDIENGQKFGNPNLGKVKSVLVRFDEIKLNAAEFEYFNLGIDNLRYISKTGNKTLKIIITDDDYDDYDFEEDYDDDDLAFDDDYDEDFDDNGIIDDEDVDNMKTSPKQKVVKVINKKYVNDYLTFGIVFGVEAVVVIAASILIILLYRRRAKRKTTIQ